MEYQNMLCSTENFEAYCDFIIYEKKEGNRCKIIMASFFKRGSNNLRFFSANWKLSFMTLKKGIEQEKFLPTMKDTDAYFTVLNGEYEKIEHCMIISKEIGNSYFLCTADDEEEVFYNYLMNTFDLPLLREWTKSLLDYAQLENRLSRIQNIDWCTDGTKTIPLNNKMVNMEELLVFKSGITQEWLDKTITTLMECGSIYISKRKQLPLDLGENANMDTYFQKYGYTIVDNLTRQLHPLAQKKPRVETIALKSKKLFPQQAVCVNGVEKLLEHSKYALLNEGMGCGKSLQAVAAVEAYHVKKYLSGHPGQTLQDVYNNPSCINYRVIIMAPGHLLEKWAEECHSQLPYVKVEIFKKFSQVVDVWKKGKQRNGREVYIASKDFLKLSGQYRPIPYKIMEKDTPVLYCSKCGNSGPIDALAKHKKCSCGSKTWKIERSGDESKKGLICPECGEVLLSTSHPLQPADFAGKTDLNSKCYFCGAELWTMNVRNLNTTKEHNSKWHKISHFANKTHKIRTTSWVLDGHEEEFYAVKNIETAYVEDGAETKMRKISPCIFIKKHMKDFFDVCIFDEIHLYKGGGTAQGNAMHCLIKASRKVLGLTGTIAGGVAEDLFYLLWRLDPGRMVKRGFHFHGATEFTKRYGTIETAYENDGNNCTHNSSSRGKKLSQPKTKPGISPLIFGDFLIDKAVFLDLEDMGSRIPELHENVVTVKMDENILFEYWRVIGKLRKESSVKNALNPLSSAMLNFSLSYLDKPYGCGPIIHPKTGDVVVTPSCFEPKEGELLPKEQKLVEIIKNELKESRRVFVYAEYTGKGETCVTKRLKEVIENHCSLKGKVAIMESSKPAATKREEWIHKMAEKGIEVFITNPRNVETGLDFIFSHNSVEYNYPTLIFYQMGYNLFTLWQASRRHLRLNQKKECRTFYMAYENTIQMAVLEVMGSKQIATSAIQGGNFSSEGLSAMATGVDARLKMIQALQENRMADSEEIQKMFASKKKVEDEFADFDTATVPLFSDLLIKKDENNNSAADNQNRAGGNFPDKIDFFSLFANINIGPRSVTTDSAAEKDRCVKPIIFTEQKKTTKKAVKGQLSLF